MTVQAHPLVRLTAVEMASKLLSREITSVELTQSHLDRIAEVEPTVNAFLHVNSEEALEVAAEVDRIREAGGPEAEALHPLVSVPIAVKDLIVTKGQPTTAASKMLEGWMSPYDATVIEKIREAKLPILGKTNLDEFAMGSSTEHSAYGITRNPWDVSRIPEAREAVRPQRSPPSRLLWRWAPTPAAPSGSKPRSPEPWGPSPHTVACRGTGPSPWPPRWTRSVRAHAPCRTPLCSTN